MAPEVCTGGTGGLSPYGIKAALGSGPWLMEWKGGRHFLGGSPVSDEAGDSGVVACRMAAS